ncbi:MAG: nuclear transport factor 2 family protein [Chloroflexi bacterium]|nr:MAG: nuclear transport factor 2 family protein [Chloroflexota bacterium]
MPLAKDTVAAWLRSYVQAWLTYDPDAIGALFADDASYTYHPFDEPVRGRVAIVASWLEGKDAPGTYEGSYEPVAIDSDLAVVNGRSRYFKDASKSELDLEYDNIFLIQFDDRGRCRSFREWYMPRRGQTEPATA